MTDDLTAGRSSCILLGLPDDARTHFAFAHAGHRCHALRRPEPVDESFQEAFCLTERHVECPRYRMWAARQPSAAATTALPGAGIAAAGGVAAAGRVDPPEPAPAAEELLDLGGRSAGQPPAGDAAPSADGEPPAPETAMQEDGLWSAILGDETPAAGTAGTAEGAEGAEAGDGVGMGSPTPGTDVLVGAAEPVDGEPDRRQRTLEPVPAAAPSLSRGPSPSVPVPEPGGGRGRLGGLVRGAILALLLVAAAGAAGYGLAFVMTRMSEGSGVALASPSTTPTIPSAPAGSATTGTTPSPTPAKTPALTASPDATPAPSKTPVYRVHVVKSGETISTIAVKYKTTVKAIVDLNKLANPNLIYAGQKLLIPPK